MKLGTFFEKYTLSIDPPLEEDSKEYKFIMGVLKNSPIQDFNVTCNETPNSHVLPKLIEGE